MNIRATATATAIAIAIAAPALAGTLEEPVPAVPVAPPPPPPNYDWTGLYGGLQLGFLDAELGGTNDDGVSGGLHSGYNHDFGRFVLGGEVQHDFTDLSFDPGEDLNGLTRLKVRAGYDFDRVLPYLTAGGVYGSGDGINEWGWTASAGVDVLLNDIFSVGAEVIYDDIDTSGVDFDSTTIAARLSYRF